MDKLKTFRKGGFSRNKMQSSSKRRKMTSANFKASGNLQAQLDKAVKSAVEKSVDLKGADSHVSVGIDTTLTTNVGMFLVNHINMGMGNIRRQDGDITMKSLRVKFLIETVFKHEAVLGNLKGQEVRVSVVYDKNPQGTVPTFNEIFANIDKDGTKATYFDSNVSYNNTDRFSVLRDEILTIMPAVADSVGTEDKLDQLTRRDWYIDLKKRKLRLKRNVVSGVISDIVEGALYLIYKAKHQTVLYTTSTITHNCRLRFIDL